MSNRFQNNEHIARVITYFQHDNARSRVSFLNKRFYNEANASRYHLASHNNIEIICNYAIHKRINVARKMCIS